MLKNYYEIHGFYDKVFDDLDIELAELDWIMCEILGKKRSQLPLCGNFLESEYKEIETAISERLKLKPLGYIFGKSEIQTMVEMKVVKFIGQLVKQLLLILKTSRQF